MTAYDILVLGATGQYKQILACMLPSQDSPGFTGRLVARYLHAHKSCSSYTLALGARSLSKLDAVYKDLSLPETIRKVQVDVLNEKSIEKAIKDARIVINTVGVSSQFSSFLFTG